MEFADTSLFEIIYNRTMNLESDVLISIMKNIADGTFSYVSVHTRSWGYGVGTGIWVWGV
jgi:hypothetical protein